MDQQDTHYTPENTKDGVHSCSDTACMSRGVPDADLSQIGYSLNVLLEALGDTSISTAVFRTDDGLYVLLTTQLDDGSRAVIGAVYTPTLLSSLRAAGYTLTWAEHEGGVN